MRSKFCLSSTASFEKINRAQTNRSTTKKTFSFSKTNRFQESKPVCPLATYGSDFQARKPAAGIGYGSRSDFTKCLTASPSSSKYNLRTFWDEGISKRKGAKFALSRDKVMFNHYIPKEPLSVPSPSHYNNEKLPSKTSFPKYTLRQKTTIVDKKMTIQSQNKNPGPGSYINPEIDQSLSRSRISKFQHLSYGQSKSKRFLPSQTISPGPGNYKDINTISNNGHYPLSQSKGGTKAKFDSEPRETMFDRVFRKEIEKPGPGYYQAPSEFGQYDGDIYTEMRQSKRSKNGWNFTERRRQK